MIKANCAACYENIEKRANLKGFDKIRDYKIADYLKHKNNQALREVALKSVSIF